MVHRMCKYREEAWFIVCINIKRRGSSCEGLFLYKEGGKHRQTTQHDSEPERGLQAVLIRKYDLGTQGGLQLTDVGKRLAHACHNL